MKRARPRDYKKDGSLDDNKKSAPICLLSLSLSLNFAFSRGPGGGFFSLFLSLSRALARGAVLENSLILSLFSVDFLKISPTTHSQEREKSFCVF